LGPTQLQEPQRQPKRADGFQKRPRHIIFSLFISHSHPTEQQVRAAKWRVFVFPWSAVIVFRTLPLHYST
jgi:hypothetical protein